MLGGRRFLAAAFLGPRQRRDQAGFLRVGLAAAVVAAMGTTLTLAPSVAGAADRGGSSVPAFATEWDGEGHLRVVRYETGGRRSAVEALAASDPGADVVTAERDTAVRALGSGCG